MSDERVVPGVTEQKYIDEHVARYQFALPHVEGKDVLDAACGSGYGSAILSEKAKSVLGVDYSPEAVDIASRGYTRPNIIFTQVNLDTDELPIRDTVISFETIEHLKNPQRFLNHVFSTASLFIFSLPIKCPNPYHLHVFNSIEDAKSFIGRDEDNIMWFGQKMSEGDTAIGTIDPSHQYLLGIWKK